MMGSIGKKNKRILDTAMEAIEELPYQVSLRWLFYRLLELGLYPDKTCYKTFTDLLAHNRKRFLHGWRPDSLVDDTRQAFYRGLGQGTMENAVDSMIEGLTIPLSHFPGQRCYTEVWFESEAMSRQFQYYTKGVTLRPFKGDLSIEPKWRASQELEYFSKAYGLPVMILYFGDLDPKGKKIPESAIRDVREWCDVDIELVVCGLTQEQVDRYGLVPNLDKPGYQWEALHDDQAREVITEGIKPYLSTALVDEVARSSEEMQEEIKSVIREWWYGREV